VLGILRERGRKGLPCEELYRQLFNPQLYLLAYGRIYANGGAMTAGTSQETADGMSEGKIGAIIEALRHERYRFAPVRRVFIPKKNGKMRPLGMPTWSDKLVGEVVRLLLEAYYEPQFSDRSHGFRKGRGCHTALGEIQRGWTGTTWFIEGDISDCLDPWSYCSFADRVRSKWLSGRAAASYAGISCGRRGKGGVRGVVLDLLQCGQARRLAHPRLRHGARPLLAPARRLPPARRSTGRVLLVRPGA
jgi:hypothetical protein